MRSTRAFAVLGLLALAGCASPSNPAAPGAQVAANGQAADGQDPTAAAVKKTKNCIVGTHVCTTEQQVDPTVYSMSGGALAQTMQGHQVGGQKAPQ